MIKMQGYLVLTFRDQFLQETVRRFELNDGVGATAEIRLAHLYTRAGEALGVIADATDAAIVNIQMVVTDTEYALVVSKAGASTNVSDDGVLSVALVDGINKKGTVRVPSPRHTALLTDGSPDDDNAIWQTLVNLFGTGEPLKLSDGDSVNTSASGSNGGILKTWRASRGRRNK